MKQKRKHINGIYAIQVDTNLYIGSSKNIESRWKSHCNLLIANKHHCKKFQEYFNNSLQKNVTKLSFVILQEIDKTLNLSLYEETWIDRARHDGFRVFNENIYKINKPSHIYLPNIEPAYFTPFIRQFNNILTEI